MCGLDLNGWAYSGRVVGCVMFLERSKRSELSYLEKNQYRADNVITNYQR